MAENPTWVNGWIAGKYSRPAPFPKMDEGEDFWGWIEGFETGCAENAEHHLWRRRLAEYLVATLGRLYAQMADFVL
jgi:hypothetical protein